MLANGGKNFCSFSFSCPKALLLSKHLSPCIIAPCYFPDYLIQTTTVSINFLVSFVSSLIN